MSCSDPSCTCECGCECESGWPLGQPLLVVPPFSLRSPASAQGPAPALPRYNVLAWTNAIRETQASVIPANWLQVMENLLDPAHVEFLHGRFFAAGHSAICQREFDVLKDRQITDEIEALEDESDLAIANPSAVRERKIGDFTAFERITAARRSVQETKNRQQGRLAAAGRARDGNIFSHANIEMDAGKGMRFDFISQKNFGDALKVNKRS